VRPLAIGPCEGPKAHEGHEVILAGRPIPRENRARGLLTVWRCPVEGWGGYWHDLGRRAEDVGGDRAEPGDAPRTVTLHHVVLLVAAIVAVWGAWSWVRFRREVIDLLDRILEAVRKDRP
jgi:hypothetical protein